MDDQRSRNSVCPCLYAYPDNVKLLSDAKHTPEETSEKAHTGEKRLLRERIYGQYKTYNTIRENYVTAKKQAL